MLVTRELERLLFLRRNVIKVLEQHRCLLLELSHFVDPLVKEPLNLSKGVGVSREPLLALSPRSWGLRGLRPVYCEGRSHLWLVVNERQLDFGVISFSEVLLEEESLR